MREKIQQVIENEPVAVFMKGTPQFVMCGNSDRALRALREAGAPVTAVDVLPDPRIRQELSAVSGWPTIPQIFIKGELVGGADIVEELAASGELEHKLRELLTDRRIGEDVHCSDGCAGLAKRAKRAVGVAAHDELRRALHEERNRLVLDDVLDRVLQLAHEVPLVLIRSSWMVPSRKGSASAALTRRCWSRSDRPSKRGLVTITWKWSPPPVRSSTRSSSAPGNAACSKDSSRSTATRPCY
jgi:monothiol glutaredoxin